VSGIAQSFADGGIALAQPRRTPGGAAVLAATSLGSSLVFASGALVNVVLAAVGHDLKLSSLQLQWLLNAELLPLAALTLVAGALGDRLGRRSVFLAGLLLFAVGTLASGLAPAWPSLVAARLATGVGEALVLPNGLAILGQAFAADRKAFAVGVWSAVAAVASAVAPFVAGALLGNGHWRLAFAAMVPVALVALVVAILWTPASPPRGDTSIDVTGVVFSALGLGALGWGLTQLTNGGGALLPTVGSLAVAALSVVAFLSVERRRGARAMLPLALVGSRAVLGVNLFTILLYGPFTAILTLLPFVMIRGAGLTPFVAGAAFIPLQVLITTVSPLAGGICRRTGRRAPLIVGALVVAVSCALALRIDAHASYWRVIFPAVLALAVGMSLAIAPLSTLVLTSVDAAWAGTAAGVNSAASRVGSLVAVALLGGVLQGGPGLVGAFHVAMTVAAGASVLAALVVLIVPPGPHLNWIARD
jgi:MFS family permease